MAERVGNRCPVVDVCLAYALSLPARRTAKARALELCDRCPVTGVCLDYALSLPATGDFGIWGGTTEKERVGLRRARKQHQPPRSGRTLQEAASI